MWFAAHIIMSLRVRDGEQDLFPVWENIVLFDTESRPAAERLAQTHGQEEEAVSDLSFTWNGRPARWVFAGVRKIISCENEHLPPSNGTEVSYSEFVLRSIEDVERLSKGETIELAYEE